MKNQTLLTLIFTILILKFGFAKGMNHPLNGMTQTQLDEIKRANIQRLNHLSELLMVNYDSPEMANYVEKEAHIIAQKPENQLNMNLLNRAAELKRSAREKSAQLQGAILVSSVVQLPQSP